MKKEYFTPRMETHLIQLVRMVSDSQTSQGVYTDDSQTTDKALVKGLRNYDVWDEDWNEDWNE